MRILVLSFLILGFIATPVVSKASLDPAQAQQFIDNLAETAINSLGDKTLDTTERRARFSHLLEQNFDIAGITRFVMGRYWRQANAQEQQQLVEIFKNLIITLYADRLQDYDSQTVDVTGAKLDNSGKYALVQSRIHDPKAGQTANVVWRVHEKSNNLKIIDVAVEGLSMGLSQRSEISASIQRNGGSIARFITEMEQRIAREAQKN